MALSSRRSARRSIITVAVALLTVEFLALSAGNTSARADSGETRPGCGTYCQSAGPVQGGDGRSGQPAVTILSSGTVTFDSDGYLPVTLTCNLSVPCRGALIAWAVDAPSPPTSNGGYLTALSDLPVDAGATATLGIRMSAPFVAYIRAHSPASVYLFYNVGPSFGCSLASGSELPGCGGTVVHGFELFAGGGAVNVVAPG
jgi:hypothetical protein